MAPGLCFILFGTDLRIHPQKTIKLCIRYVSTTTCTCVLPSLMDTFFASLHSRWPFGQSFRESTWTACLTSIYFPFLLPSWGSIKLCKLCRSSDLITLHVELSVLVIGWGEHPTCSLRLSRTQWQSCGSFPSNQHLKHENFLCTSATCLYIISSFDNSDSRSATRWMRYAVRLSVDTTSAVRFRNAQALVETIWGTCQGALKHSMNGRRRRARLRRKSGLRICHLMMYIFDGRARGLGFGSSEQHIVAFLLPLIFSSERETDVIIWESWLDIFLCITREFDHLRFW